MGSIRLKNLFTEKQLSYIENIYYKNHKPRHVEKIQITNDLNLLDSKTVITGVIVNKWFQARRNQEKEWYNKKI
jgi:hypothetical protein